MLNPNSNKRELAYIVTIDEIKSIPNYDRVEHARVNGWWIIVKKNQFKVGDYAIYIEVDSKVPETEPFMFLEKKHFKVKTQKMCKVLSQGLLMSIEDFTSLKNPPGWALSLNARIKEGKNIEYEFLTEVMNITYADAMDNKRKAPSTDKYKKMAQRNGKLFSKQPFRWLMKRNWGKKLLFIFFGKKRDKKGGWPAWVKKTDEERAQNQVWRFREDNTEKWIVSEKIDGTSTTATWKRGKRKKHEFYICSRNVVFDKPDKGCYYQTNVYTEMAEKYHFEEVLEKIANRFNLEWVTLQGETYGEGIQKRDYSIKGHDFAGFNLIFSDRGRLNSYEAKDIMAQYGIPWVPLICDNYVLPATVEEILLYAEGTSAIDGKPREGFVFRSQDGSDSFKAVSNQFLLKYHE